MSPEAALEPLVVEQRDPADADAVATALQEAFVAVREAIAAGRPVVAVVRDTDLLGQDSPEAAALATGLLGMVRALAMEGASHGWSVNAVSRGEGEQTLDETIRWLGTSGLSGQLVRSTTEHLGRIWP